MSCQPNGIPIQEELHEKVPADLGLSQVPELIKWLPTDQKISIYLYAKFSLMYLECEDICNGSFRDSTWFAC